jgi:hypothetical protein
MGEPLMPEGGCGEPVGVETKGYEGASVFEDEVSKVASLVEECYRAWRKAGELLEKLEEIAVRDCLDRYRPGHPDLSWFYDDQFEPLWTLEDEGYVRFRWAGRKLYLEARIHRDGRVECIAREHTIS